MYKLVQPSHKWQVNENETSILYTNLTKPPITYT